MAGVASIPVARTLGANVIFDDDADATASADLDQESTTLHSISVTSTVAGYLHLWDSRAPVVGTDPQDYSFPCINGHTDIDFIGGLPFSVGLSWAYTTDKGTAANTSPGTPPDVWAITVPTD